MSLIFAHFPLFILFTIPFFVFPLRLLLRRRSCTLSNLYIFALYYIALVELVLTILFIGGLIFDFTSGAVHYFLEIALLLYLTVALKNAYELKWLQSLLYAVVTSAMYIVTTLVAIMVVSFVSIIAMVM